MGEASEPRRPTRPPRSRRPLEERHRNLQALRLELGPNAVALLLPRIAGARRGEPMNRKLGTCPTCGTRFPEPPPGKVMVWSVHRCPGTPQQQADAAAEAKRQKAQKAKPK